MSRFPSKRSRVSEPTPVEALIGAVVMIRRDTLDQVGGFDEDYFFFLEETDLAMRIRGNGWQVVHEPRASAVHLQGTTAGKHEAEARIEFYRSRYLFFRKQYGIVQGRVLHVVLCVNLTLNVLALGMANLFTGGSVQALGRKLRVRARLWRWHLAGCPEGHGLPRT